MSDPTALDADALATPCGHEPAQSASQLHGVCIFCWRDRAGALLAERKELLRRVERQEAALQQCRALLSLYVDDVAGLKAEIDALRTQLAEARRLNEPISDYRNDIEPGE